MTTLPPAPLLLSLEGAQVHFGAQQARQPLDLPIHRGERIALVGANGSGKTTLLRLLHGLILPARGRRELHRLPADDRLPRAAMLFQRPFLLHLSVWRNLMLALWLGRVPRDERRARALDALARVGLQSCADRPARALSGGPQQRLVRPSRATRRGDGGVGRRPWAPARATGPAGPSRRRRRERRETCAASCGD